ncbi:hypothetical protein MNEG_12881 [Monoraphidium neglectum]|uniref:Uncharacterized protein n=1 Tax=Monoraphidium neglectum TaxID=145388 RepID=A0A0D2J5C0_9CHLO|nr:hypothetical protein MNEG_12881 [Monoraphidium neglectum]KIY95082.1 hypothetical protein MNEG_12881 [Monoraphidium neglectum]|eukprot:XP_013894102.1 hypothetical protein MNEG_12881 [Monoraphidium neglectum]
MQASPDDAVLTLPAPGRGTFGVDYADAVATSGDHDRGRYNLGRVGMPQRTLWSRKSTIDVQKLINECDRALQPSGLLDSNSHHDHPFAYGEGGWPPGQIPGSRPHTLTQQLESLLRQADAGGTPDVCASAAAADGRGAWRPAAGPAGAELQWGAQQQPAARQRHQYSGEPASTGIYGPPWQQASTAALQGPDDAQGPRVQPRAAPSIRPAATGPLLRSAGGCGGPLLSSTAQLGSGLWRSSLQLTAQRRPGDGEPFAAVGGDFWGSLVRAGFVHPTTAVPSFEGSLIRGAARPDPADGGAAHHIAARPNFARRRLPAGSYTYVIMNVLVLVVLVAGSVLDAVLRGRQQQQQR